MSTHANAAALLTWLNGRASTTVGEIVASGLMKSRTASSAIQYALKSGAIERVVHSAASERVQYRATGGALPLLRPRGSTPSFDGLLDAWGIPREPVKLSAIESRKYQISDGE